MKCNFLAVLVATLWVGHAAADIPRPVPDPIPYTKSVLSNGLTLLVHEDHKAPIVAVNLWYHVGSKNEVVGKTGFAHLFEHLMFGSTEHSKERFMDAMERIGATSMNGTTNVDRTNYFENVPTSALDYTLWMESERMGYFLGALDQKVLDLQRGVVQNEKRQGENRPYGVVRQLLTKNTYPLGHPYSWTTIGDMADLDAASLKDVQEWFKTYYGPSNAVLVLAGDVEPQSAKASVERYFGSIPAGPPLARHQAWIAKMSGTHRQTVQDRVPQPRIYKVWNIPGYGDLDADLLDLSSDCLSAGKSSRLYKRLVHQDQIATDVQATVSLNELGGQFTIQATARRTEDLAKVEAALDEELARFLKGGPTPAELDRARVQEEALFLRGTERVGGFGGKSDQLAKGQVLMGSPDHYLRHGEHLRGATPEALRQAAQRWLSDGVYILEVQPFPQHQASSEAVAHDQAPKVGDPVDLKLPKLQRATLKNGLKIILAERHDLPLLECWMTFDAGYAADRPTSPGLASMTAVLLTGGTPSRTSLQISDELAALGAELRAQTNLDLSISHLSALKVNLGPSLALFADVLQRPAFPAEEFQRLQKHQLSEIQREESSPMQMGLRVLPSLLYGAGHIYGNPLTGTGTSASVKALKREDLAVFHARWFHPGNATLLVVGDSTLAELVPMLDNLFADWRPNPTPPTKERAAVATPQRGIFLVDRPAAQQSLILAAQLAPPPSAPEGIALEAINDSLGGTFGSRLNMNLRESKHWSYGVGSRFVKGREERPWMIYAPVQTDQTLGSIREMQQEFRGLLKERPIGLDELAKIQANETLSLPGSRETLKELGQSILDQLQFGWPDDYYQHYARAFRALTPATVNAAAKGFLRPEDLTWVVIGDRKKVEAELRGAGLGELHILNP